MKKGEEIRRRGLTKFDRDIVWIGKFGSSSRSVVRDVYVDGFGDSWIWLFGDFHRVKESLGCGYVAI